MELQQAIQIVKNRYQTDSKRIADEKAVIEKYGFLFNPVNLDRLTAEDFKSFLLIRNNKHWDGIHRQGNMITADMDKLRSTLKLLLDENIPLKERIERILPKNRPPMIKGLGRAVLTPILLVVYPDRYAVYNSAAEEGMKSFNIFPPFKNTSFAERYVEINKMINRLARESDLSLWQIDEIWWLATTGFLPSEQGTQLIKPSDESETSEKTEESYSADLESKLEDLIVNKWESLPAFANLEILQQDGDFIGRQYDTRAVGRIDLLCKNRKSGDFVVIELKRGRESDKVVGQTLRYIGWVKKNLAKEGQKVTGIIITQEDDERLRYAVDALDEYGRLIDLKFYKISITIT